MTGRVPVLELAAVNALTAEAFVARFGDVAEHSPWVAAGAAGKRPFADRESMIQVLEQRVHERTEERELLEAIIETIREPLLVLDGGLRGQNWLSPLSEQLPCAILTLLLFHMIEDIQVPGALSPLSTWLAIALGLAATLGSQKLWRQSILSILIGLVSYLCSCWLFS